SFLIVGERVNASGSKKMRGLLSAEDWDGLVSLAREQEREGAHVLDLNVDYVGRDGVRDMHELASRLVTNVRVPLMLDSTEWEKMEAGLQHAGGKCILNSTNYEDGEPRFRKVFGLAREYGASIVVGTIDEEGMARTAEGKLKIAKRAYEQATGELDFPPTDIFFDPLALPISTGFEGVSAKSAKQDTSNLPVEERLKLHIIDGEKQGLEDDLKLALETHSALDIINDILLDGMKTVGDLFGSGQMQLPFVLQSAEVM